MTVETTNFPAEGSNHTPAHHYSEFKFKNYAPIAFRYFRDLFGIQPDDFLVCIGRIKLLFYLFLIFVVESFYFLMFFTIMTSDLNNSYPCLAI